MHQVEVSQLIARICVAIRTPHEAAEHFGVQVGQDPVFVLVAESDVYIMD